MTTRNFSSTAARTTLAAGVTSSATSLTVAATTGFPATPYILAVDAGAAGQELVLVTAVAGTTLTVTRGYDSTVAAAHDAGAVVEHSHAAIDLREANSHVNASSGVHGATGAMVGTSDAQTLTNKTLALGSNSVSGTRAQFNAAMTDDDFATLTGVETLTNKTLAAPAATGSLAGFGGAWTAYTPTLAGATQGNGTLTGGWTQIGKTVHFWARFVLGSTSTVSGGNIALGLPVAARTAQSSGALQSFITDLGVANYVGVPVLTTTTCQTWLSVTSGAYATLGGLSSTAPMTWGAGDEVLVNGTYEAA